MRTPREIIIRPLMTEKSMQQKELHNTVTFRVHPDANKVEAVCHRASSGDSR